MDGAEHQLDRPFGGDALGLERIGQPQAADHQIGAGRPHPLQLALDVLSLAHLGAAGQQGQLLGHQLPIQVGGAHLHQLHAALARQEAGQGDLHLGIGHQEQPLAFEHLAMGRQGAAAPLHQRIEHLGHPSRIDTEGRCRRGHPVAAALDTEGIGSVDQFGAARHQRPRGATEKGLGQQHLGALAYGRQFGGTPWRQAAHRLDAHFGEQGDEAVFHRIGQGADDQQLALVAAGHQRQQRQQGVVFPLGEGGFDAAAGVVQNPHPAVELAGEPFGRPREIELDHLTGTGAHQKQGADLGAPVEQIAHQAIELFVGIGQTGQIPFAQNRRAETGLGENHHPGG